MALEIIITPTLEDNGNGVSTTWLEITVDITSIMHLLRKYDLLLKTTLEVRLLENNLQPSEINIYEYSKIYKDIKETTISFSAMVLGDIKSCQNIRGKAQGVLVNK